MLVTACARALLNGLENIGGISEGKKFSKLLNKVNITLAFHMK